MGWPAAIRLAKVAVWVFPERGWGGVRTRWRGGSGEEGFGV